MKFEIGAMLESFCLPTPKALEIASSLGVTGIQMYAVSGEHAPEKMTATKKKELLALLSDNGLRFSALCGDFGKGFGNPEENPKLVEDSKRILDLAKDLGTDIVTTHIGVVPSDKSHPRYAIMQDACGKLAEYADSIGSHFAIETGPETSAVLGDFLDGLHSTGVGVNLDPANLVMVTGDDPVKAVHRLKKYIVHTHAKDGIKLRESNPEYIYHVVHPIPTEFEGVEYFREVPLGEGSVDYPAYLKALEDIGYNGFLTIERECGDNPAKDIETAAKFLKNLMK